MTQALAAWQTNTVDTRDPTPDFGMEPLRRETDLPLVPDITIES